MKTLVISQELPSAPVTVMVSPADTLGEPVMPTTWLSPLTSTAPSMEPAWPETTTCPPVMYADPLESMPSE